MRQGGPAPESPREEIGLAILRIRSAGCERSLLVPESEPLRGVIESGELPLSTDCGGVGACGSCAVRVLGGDTNPPTPADLRQFTDDQRASGLRLACQLRISGHAEIELQPASAIWGWTRMGGGVSIPAPPALPPSRADRFGIAVDLGTTHLRVALWDRRQGRRLAALCGRNPQAARGTDVLNRLSLARANSERAGELAAQVRLAILEAVGLMLGQEAAETGDEAGKVGRVVVVGNSAMLALLTGQGGEALLDPENWGRPVDCQPRDPDTWRAEWNLPQAEILLPEPLAGFVGSDLLASVVATGLVEGPPGSMLLDVGTNTEVALWDGRRLHVSSVPGGPAFETWGFPSGSAAGAINRVTGGSGRSGFAFTTLGGMEATGFCGSGLVDAVAVLLRAGILKPSGRFAVWPGSEGFRLDPDVPRSALSSLQVDAVQQAKAATASAMEELLRLAGLDWPDLNRLCLCGAFGQGLDLGNAQAVGLLPPIATERVESHPEAALAGCERALLAADPMDLLAAVAEKADLVNLPSIQGWEDRFIAHLRLAPIQPEAFQRSVR